MAGHAFLGLALFVLALALLARMGDPKSKGPLGYVVRFLRNSGYNSVALFKKLFGETVYNAFVSMWNYVLFTANPILQLVYAVIVYGAFLHYLLNGIQWLPEDSIHRPLAHAVVMGCFFSFLVASTSDPGAITEETISHYSGIYEYDNVTNFPGHNCKTCNLTKLARSKHCSLCNACIARFDHHCVWINNCVGAGNYHVFMLFVFHHVVLTLYGSYNLTLIMKAICDKSNIWNATVLNRATGSYDPVSLLDVNRFLAKNFTLLWGTTLLLYVMAVAVTLFFGFHLLNVLGNITTNERTKLGRVMEWIRDKAGQQQQVEDEARKTVKGLNPPTPSHSTATAGLSSSSLTPSPLPSPLPSPTPAPTPAALPPVRGCFPDVSAFEPVEPIVPDAAPTASPPSTNGSSVNGIASKDTSSTSRSTSTSSTSTSTSTSRDPSTLPFRQRGPDPAASKPSEWSLTFWREQVKEWAYDKGVVRNVIEVFYAAPKKAFEEPVRFDSNANATANVATIPADAGKTSVLLSPDVGAAGANKRKNGNKSRADKGD